MSETTNPITYVRDAAVRATTAAGLAAVGLIHVLDSVGKWSETRYMFWMYMALVLGTLVMAAAVLLSKSRLPLLGAAGLAASAAIGYVLSRTTGLPNATGDIGNWTEPLGLASLFVEGSVIALAGGAFALLGRGEEQIGAPAIPMRRPQRVAA